MDISIFNAKYLKKITPRVFALIKKANDIEALRQLLFNYTFKVEQDANDELSADDASRVARIRDCGYALRNIIKKSSEDAAGFSVLQALWDIGHNKERQDLKPGFYAELLYLLLGLQGQGPRKALDSIHLTAIKSNGRKAAKERSNQLDDLWGEVNRRMAAYPYGLDEESVIRREKRREKIVKALGGTLDDWQNWRWQIKNIIRDPETLEKLVKLSGTQRKAIKLARENKLPFGVTPYYLSLMDDELSRRDASIRAQVLPPMSYVKEVANIDDNSCLDFMGEEDTSPQNLITRRYPAICILKPYNTCPQICVYCQRNWEIDDVMASGAFAGMDQVDAAIEWITEHPAIHEVLITGGDPLAMGNDALAEIMAKVAKIPTVERIRIGSRTLVTMPMRITEGLVSLIAQHRKLGRREIVIMTHVQHPYEITPDVVAAVDKFRKSGIPVYNQLVYTYYVSKRFEAATLRRYLRLIGIDPYYTFNTKGKDETLAYRVPIARILQEQQEEARMLPGLARTDEAVYNVPRLGKSYLKAREYRSLLSILPDGARMYEFHSWEKKVSQETSTFISTDVPILDYLQRLSKDGESVSDYETIWYYF